MAATTAAAIRDRMITVIAGLTPTTQTGVRFQEHENRAGGNFVADSETQPQFRRFQVIETGTDEPPETSSGTDEQRTATFQITIAYPRTMGYGGDQALDRHDLMREDQRQIERAIGMHGKANFTSPYPDATWLANGTATDRQEGEVCDYLVITQRMLFLVSW